MEVEISASGSIAAVVACVNPAPQPHVRTSKAEFDIHDPDADYR
jgi:hypothetical protein